jgi:hypothetical protein
MSEEERRPPPSVRDKMNDLLDRTVGSAYHGEAESTDIEQKAELQSFGSEKHMTTLQDLNNLLYTRRSLQDLGCTFDTRGELLTYGYPMTLKENEQLLRLGPIYDEQWSSFFSSAHTIRSDGDAVMWADIRTLKRVLINEGVDFDLSHLRLTHGDGSAKLIRLCAAYADLHKLWSSEKPTHVLTAIVEQEEDASDGFDDSGCFLDDEDGHAGASASDLGCTQRESETTQYDERWRNSRGSLPRNIGWRFSDDLDGGAVARSRDSMSDDSYDEMEDGPHVAVEVPPSVTEDDMTQAPSSFHPESPQHVLPLNGGEKTPQPVNHNRLRRGPSPLQVSCEYSHQKPAERLTDAQNVPNLSMAYAEQPMTIVHDSTSTRSDVDLKAHATKDTTPSRKKGFRGWCRGVFGRTEGRASRSIAPTGGWW